MLLKFLVDLEGTLNLYDWFEKRIIEDYSIFFKIIYKKINIIKNFICLFQMGSITKIQSLEGLKHDM